MRGAPTAGVKTLADVIAFNEAHKTTEMPYFGQEMFLRAQEKGPLTDQAYRDALAKDQRLARPEGLDAVFAPGRPKLPYLRELMAIAETLEPSKEAPSR